MLNAVQLIGRLTKDVELRRTQSGIAVTLVSVAIDNPTKAPNGEKTTSFINVQIWDAQAENTAKYCHKGSLVGIQGRLQQRTYEDQKTGKQVSVLEVVANNVIFLDPKEKSTDDKKKDTKKANAADELPF